MATPWNHVWLSLNRGDIETERQQCLEEGKDLGPVQAEFDRVLGLDLDNPAYQAVAEALLDRTVALPVRANFPHREPSDLEGIRAERGSPPHLGRLRLANRQLADKVHGAWLGRVCGCLLGKPVEGWRREKMWGYLKETGRWPLARYFSYKVSPKVRRRYQLRPHPCFIENVRCMPEDDDTNYTTMGLALIKQYGRDFTPTNVADFWLSNVPILRTCTAERVAYRNLCRLIAPPRSASFRNPYREWIGAQIRGDFFGYANPGQPARAAEFAWRDACISHVKNGIYGEMWSAAMNAAALATDDLPTIIRAGLAQIPRRSRLHAQIEQVLEWHAAGVDYDEAVDRLHRQWDETTGQGWCHTISNAMVVAIGLLWGGLDYERSICRAVQPCFDTDCNGATVGSIVGAVLGAKRLPKKWTAPVRDTLQTGVAGYHRVRISDLAKETLAVIDQIS